MPIAQGVAGAIEACAARDPEVAAKQLAVFTKLKLPALGLLVAGGLVAAAGALVHDGQLPALPTAAAANLLAAVIPAFMTNLLVRYVDSISRQVSETPKHLHDRYLGAAMMMATIWNRFALFFSGLFVFATNVPFFSDDLGGRINPYVALAAMPFSYFCAGYSYYAVRLILIARRGLTFRTLGDGT